VCDLLLPDDDAGELDWLLYRQHGVLGRRQALRFFTVAAIKHRIASGRWRLVHRSVYLTHLGALTSSQERWVAVLATRGLLGGLSALHCAGLRGWRADLVHVVIPAGRQDVDAPTDVVVHRTSRLPRSHIHPVGQPPFMMPARAAVDAAQWSGSDDRAAAVVAAAVQQGLAGAAEIGTVLDQLPRARRRRLVRGLIGDLAGRAGSVPEVEFLRLCRRAGLPAPVCQQRRTDANGRRRYLDAYFEAYGVHVEIDGGQHTDSRWWWADMKRQNDLWIPGDRVLRFPAWVVRHRPEDVAAQVRAALVAAGWSSIL
jgi:hypothetical protein